MKRIIDLEAEKALKERVAWHSVVVTATDKKFQHGTGISLTYEDRFFVVTCLHTIKDISPDKLRFIWRSECPLIDVEKEDIKKSLNRKGLKYNTVTECCIIKIYRSLDTVDLVAIELDKTIKIHTQAFFELNTDNIVVSKSGLSLIMMGFPGEIAVLAKSRKTGEVGNIGFLHTDWPKIIEYKNNQEALPAFDSEIHFLMEIY